MKFACLLATIVSLLSFATTADAQYHDTRIGDPRAPVNQSWNILDKPAVSPYLELSRPGASAGLNYYNRVRPKQEARREFQQQRINTQTLQQDQRRFQQQQQEPHRAISNPFTAPPRDRITGASQGIRPTGQGSGWYHPRSITGERSRRTPRYYSYSRPDGTSYYPQATPPRSPFNPLGN